MRYFPTIVPLLLPSLAHAAEIIETVTGPVEGTGDGMLVLDSSTATDGWISANPFHYGGNGISLAASGASGTYYFAFDWLVTDNGGEAASGSGFFGGLGFYLSDGGGNQVRSLAGNPWTGRFFGLGEVGSDVNTPVEYEVGTTARIVLHVKFNPGASDDIVMYVNPPAEDPFVEGDPSGIVSASVTDDWSFNTLLSRAGGGAASISNLQVAIPGFVDAPVTIWDGDESGNWATAATWDNDVLPEEGELLFFQESEEWLLTNDLEEGFPVGGLSFGADASAYEINGNGILLSGPIANAPSTSQRISLPLLLDGDLEIQASGRIDLLGVISGPHGLIKSGPGIVELHADNSYTGDTSIGGTLSLGDGMTGGSIAPESTVIFGSGTGNRLEFSRSEDLTFPNPIATGGRANVATISVGAVTVSGAVSGGGEFWTYGDVVIEPNPASAERTSSNVLAMGTLELSDLSPETLGGGNFYLGALGGEGTLRYTGPSDSTDRFGTWVLQSFGSSTHFDIVQEDTNLTITSTVHGAEIRGFTKLGEGTLTLAAAPGYQGDTIISSGTLSLQQIGLSDQASVRIASGATLDLAFDDSDSVAGLLLGGEVQGAGIYSAATHPESFTGQGSLEVLSADLTPSLTWGGEGTDDNWSTAANWTPANAPAAGDVLAFGAAGGTLLNDLPQDLNFGGIIFPTESGSYELTGNAIILSGALQNGSESNQTIALPIELASTLRVSTSESDVLLTQPVSGPFGLTKIGDGTLALHAENTYTGRTAISGVLEIGDGETAGSIVAQSNISFGADNNSRLEINRSDDVVLSNTLITGGRANIATTSTGSVTLNNAITGAGEFWTYGNITVAPHPDSASRNSSNVIASGRLEIESFGPETLGEGNFFIAQSGAGTLSYTGPGESTDRLGAWALQGSGSNATIEIADPDATLTLTSAIGDVGGNGLTKTGPGTLALGAAPTYNGGTMVEQGTLSLLQISLPDAHPVRIADGAMIHLSFSGSDEITALILGEDPQAPGTYNASTHPAYFSGTGSLVIPGGELPEPFLAWLDAFPSLTDPADQVKTADPDGDGLNNLAEFALDGNPSDPSPDGKLRIAVDSDFLTLTLPVRSGATFTGSGPRVAEVTSDGLIYSIQGSSDLDDFSAEVAEAVPALSSGLPSLSGGWEYRTFRLAAPIDQAARGFLRVEIAETP